MTWGMVSSGPTYRAPMRARIMDRGQDFSYSSTGWASESGGGGGGGGWKGGTGHGSSSSSGSKPASNAAVSALALLSFLFFLNMLQQQLSSGQQQTLLFMVNNTNGTRFNRRVRRPLIAVASVQAKQGLNGRTKLTVKAMRNGKIRVRKQRDLEDEMQEKNQHLDAGPPQEVEDGFESETEPPIMMAGMPHASSLQLSAWLRGQLGVNDLRNDLVDTLTNCRAVVACTVHKAAKQNGFSAATNALSDDMIGKLLGEAGEYAEVGHLDEACEDLLLSAGEDCNLLAKSFSSLLPPLDKNHNPTLIKEQPALTQNAKGDV